MAGPIAGTTIVLTQVSFGRQTATQHATLNEKTCAHDTVGRSCNDIIGSNNILGYEKRGSYRFESNAFRDHWGSPTVVVVPNAERSRRSGQNIMEFPSATKSSPVPRPFSRDLASALSRST